MEMVKEIRSAQLIESDHLDVWFTVLWQGMHDSCVRKNIKVSDHTEETILAEIRKVAPKEAVGFTWIISRHSAVVFGDRKISQEELIYRSPMFFIGGEAVRDESSHQMVFLTRFGSRMGWSQGIVVLNDETWTRK